MQAISEAIPISKMTRLVAERTEKIFYELVAYYLSDGSAPEDEAPTDRGHRLEPLAIEYLSKEYNLTIEEVGIWQADHCDDRIYVSPDGYIKDKKIPVEVKCLSGWKYVKAWFTNTIPDDYMNQIFKYFIVNQESEKLLFVFYRPEITLYPMHLIVVKREDYTQEIKALQEEELQLLRDVDSKVQETTNLFFGGELKKKLQDLVNNL